MLSLKHIKRQYIIYISAKKCTNSFIQTRTIPGLFKWLYIVRCTVIKCSTCHNVNLRPSFLFFTIVFSKDCKCDFKWRSNYRVTCSIHDYTLKSFFWSSMLHINNSLFLIFLFSIVVSVHFYCRNILRKLSE